MDPCWPRSSESRLCPTFGPATWQREAKGAPLVPFVDYLLYADPKLGRVSLNVGGIANITAMPPGGKAEDVIAFDTGPGNIVVDQLVSVHTQNRRKYDSGGQLAAKGKVNRKLLDSLIEADLLPSAPTKNGGSRAVRSGLRSRFDPHRNFFA